MDFRRARRRGRHDVGRIRHRPAVEQEVVLGEPEAFPAELLGQLNLVEHVLVILREGRIQVRKVGREQVHVESHFACNPLAVTRIVPHFLSLPS